MTSHGPIAGNSSGFFLYNTDENYLHSFTKANHLSDIGLTAVEADGSNVYVGYSNGNIDILDISEFTTINIPELKRFENAEDKRINGIYRHGSSLYCSTNCGLVHVDLNKHEIKSRYQIDFVSLPKVNDVAVFRDSLYAATSIGLFRAYAKSSMLEDGEQWTQCGNVTSNISSVGVVNDSIIVSIGSLSGTNTISLYADDVFVTKLKVAKFRSIYVPSDASSITIASTDQVNQYDTSFQKLHTAKSYDFGEEGKAASMTANKALCYKDHFYIADGSNGLVRTDYSSVASKYCPNGPSNNYSYHLVATRQGVFCTGGGVNSAFNNLNRNIYIHSYVDNAWTTASEGQRDPINIICDPNKRDTVYFSTWGNGIFKFDVEKQKIIDHYTAKNSALIDIFSGDKYTRTSAIAYDSQSNLYVAQASVIPGIVVKDESGEWYELSYPITDELHSTRKMIFTKNGNGWLLIPRTEKKGVFVFNTNGTVDDDSDDMFRGPFDTSDSRDKGKIEVVDSYGELITTDVLDIVEDQDGILWLGTDQGVLTFNGDKSVFTTPTPVFSHIKVPRNDGTNNADYLLDGVNVTSIAVDGANRKWIGTSTDGVYLLSADGLETIHAFNVDNSPLISNEINSIAIHPATGEVFFATPLGIVSYAGDATEPEEVLSEIKVWPNPVRPSFVSDVKMSGFSCDCSVRITDAAGRIVYSTRSLGGSATWNCKNLDGNRVSTGVYVIWVIDADGNEKLASKILVVK